MNAMINVAKEILRFAILVPLIPILVLLMVYLGWVIGKARKYEDLEEQVRCANAQNMKMKQQ
jgi:Flp pilus assembly protein TadG